MLIHEHLRLMNEYASEVHAADQPYHALLVEAIEAAQAAGRFRGIKASGEAEMIMALVLARIHNVVLAAPSWLAH